MREGLAAILATIALCAGAVTSPMHDRPVLRTERAGFSDTIHDSDSTTKPPENQRKGNDNLALASSHADESIRDAAIHHVRKAGEFDTDSDGWENARRDFISKLPLPEAWNDRFEDNYEALWGLAEISLERDWLADRLQERIGLPWWRCRRDNKSRWKLRQQAEDLSIPLVRLRQFKFVRDPGVLSAVYHNPNTPPDTRTEVHKQLVELATRYSVYVPDRLMEPTLLDFLYDMQVRLIRDTREMTEGNFLLFGLIKEENPLDQPFPATRLARVLNPTTPHRILKIMATREGHRIVRAAAQKALANRSDEGGHD